MKIDNNSAVVPAPKLENDFYDWYERHENKKAAVCSKRFDLIFIGDSITHFFEGHPGFDNKGDAIWRQFYGDCNALNLGFGWDRTQNVLWRLQNGEFENQSPGMVVLNIGTNNLSETGNARANTVDEITAGIRAVCDLIFSRSRKTEILIMGLFPRGLAASDFRKDISRINAKLKLFAELTPQTAFIDIGERFVDADGNIDPLLMPDLVHPSSIGYRIWAESISHLLQPVLRS